MDVREVRIRSATRADRGFVLATAKRLAGFDPGTTHTPEQIVAADSATLAGYFSRWRTARRALRRVLLGSCRGAMLIAESAGDPLGFAYVHRAWDYFGHHEIAYLSVIAVAAHAERRGVGSALMRAAEAWAEAHGYRLMTLNVFAANRPACALYDRFGYTTETVRYVKALGAAPPPRRR